MENEIIKSGENGVIIGKLFLSIVPVAMIIWLCRTYSVTFQLISANPDMTGDGAFTVRDLIPAAIKIFFSIGDAYQSLFAQTKFGPFLEMSSENPNFFWSLFFTGFVYFLISSLIPVWKGEWK